MFPRGFKHKSMWQNLQDIVSPVEIYLSSCLCVCVRGVSLAPFFPSPSFSHLSLSFVAAEVFFEVFFSTAEHEEPVSVCIWQEARRNEENGVLWQPLLESHLTRWNHHVFYLPVWHTPPHTLISEHRSQSGHLQFDQSISSYLCSWMWPGRFCSTSNELITAFSQYLVNVKPALECYVGSGALLALGNMGQGWQVSPRVPWLAHHSTAQPSGPINSPLSARVKTVC